MTLILCGVKGCGKSYFGKKLSTLLHLPLLDIDTLIIACYHHHTGLYLSIRQIYQYLQESAFRRLEHHIIQQCSDIPSIIALGGGSLTLPSSILHLQSIGQLIHLHSSFDRLRTRSSSFPSFLDAQDPVEALYALYQHRTALYTSLDIPTLDTTLFTTTQIITQLYTLSTHGKQSVRHSLSYHHFWGIPWSWDWGGH